MVGLLSAENRLMRRVAGYHDIRLDGMVDILSRAKDSRVLDIGCNRGRVSDDFYRNGASLVHGCDIDEQCILTARNVFADLRSVDSKFELVDLTGGPKAFHTAFGDQHYDITVMLATYHKLKRVMSETALTDLMKDFGRRTEKYFAWRATSDKPDENERERQNIDRDLGPEGFKRIHTSYISQQLGMCAIWAR